MSVPLTIRKFLLLGFMVLGLAVFGTAPLAAQTAGATDEPSPGHPFRSEDARDRFLKVYDLRAKDWPVPQTTLMADTSYGPTFVRICGPEDAPPLVLLHGAGGNSLQWISNIRTLSGHFRIYAVDNIHEFGRSVYLRDISTPDDFTAWLDELFTALNLSGNINLVGLSYGGWLTAEYALRFPGRLHKIVLLAPAATILPLDLEWIMRAILCPLPNSHFTKSFLYWLLDDLVHRDQAGRLLVDQWAADQFLAMQSFKPKRLVNPRILEDHELANIQIPVLVLIGEHEKIYSAHEALDRLHRVAPDIQTELVPGAGHDLTAVQADLVDTLIIEFLSRP
jgi:pimeloyl-ACP methyl ester carboxylesterase